MQTLTEQRPITMIVINHVGALTFAPQTALALPQIVTVADFNFIRMISLSDTTNELRADLEVGNFATAITFSDDGRMMFVASAPQVEGPAFAPTLSVFDTQTADLIAEGFLGANAEAMVYSINHTVLAIATQTQVELWGIP